MRRAPSMLFCLALAAVSAVSSEALAAKKHAKKHRPIAHAVAGPRAAPAKHHERFIGGGTGGDSPKPGDGEGGPELLLTFDDGPTLDKTPKVLDLLDQHGYKAVFFVCGTHFQGKNASAEKSRALLREIVRRGHAVGNHTIHHLFLCGASGGPKAVEEIEGNGKLIAEALGEPPYLFRTPYGAHCPTLAATLKSIGVRPIGWDIDPQDWRLKNAPKIEAAVKASIRNITGRQILLLHDVQPATIVALPAILDFIDEENLRRKKVGQAQIKVISYDYLLADRPVKAPLIDALARLALEAALPVLNAAGIPMTMPPAPAAPNTASPSGAAPASDGGAPAVDGGALAP